MVPSSADVCIDSGDAIPMIRICIADATKIDGKNIFAPILIASFEFSLFRLLHYRQENVNLTQ